MNKLSATAKKLDVFFKVIGVLLSIAAVACLVCLGIIAAGYIFDLAPEQIGTGYDNMEIGFLELQLAEGYAPDTDLVLLREAVQLALTSVFAFVCRFCVRCIRNILRPMTEGAPFHSAVSKNLKKIAILSLILGMAANCIRLVDQIILVHAIDLPALLTGGPIARVTVDYTFDISFLAAGAVLLLLSYVFRYGEQLQQLSDETL